MPVEFYEAEVTDGNPDPNLPGHIKVKIPQLFRDDECPALIAPMYPGSPFGGWHSIAWPTNPDDDAAPVRVIVAHLGGNSFRWLGSSQSWTSISDNPETRAGARSPDGRHSILLDNNLGVYLIATSTADAEKQSFINIDPRSDRIQMGTANGVGLIMEEGTFGVTANHALQMNPDGVLISHKDGISYLAMEDGNITKLGGGNIQIAGSTIEMGGGTTPPVHPYPLMLTLLAALKLLADDVVACGLAIPAGAPYTAVNATAFSVNAATSIASGLPYLSKRIYGD